ncbi:MAG: hypothetical protein RL329_413 [Bacteroidota bacterium]
MEQIKRESVLKKRVEMLFEIYKSFQINALSLSRFQRTASKKVRSTATFVENGLPTHLGVAALGKRLKKNLDDTLFKS